MSAASAGSPMQTSDEAKTFALRYCQLLTVRNFLKTVIDHTNIHFNRDPDNKYQIHVSETGTVLYDVILQVKTPATSFSPTIVTYYRYNTSSTRYITRYLRAVIHLGFQYREWAFSSITTNRLPVQNETVAIRSTTDPVFSDHYSWKLSVNVILYGEHLAQLYDEYKNQGLFRMRTVRELHMRMSAEGLPYALYFPNRPDFVRATSESNNTASTEPSSEKFGPADLLTIAVMYSDGNLLLIKPSPYTFIDSGTDFIPNLHLRHTSLETIEARDYFQTDEEEEGTGEQESMGNSAQWQMEEEEDGSQMPMATNVQTVDLNQTPFGDDDSEDSF